MATFIVYRRQQPFEILIDDADLVWVSQFQWSLSEQRYCYRHDTDRGYVRLHREVMGIRDRKVYVDHKDGNRLDNRRENLRVATPQQNAANNAPKSCYAGNARGSTYKGVSRRRERWRMNIKLPDGRKIDKLYNDEQEAARAYDGLSLFFYGPFCRKNFPDSVADTAWGEVLQKPVKKRVHSRRVTPDKSGGDTVEVSPGRDLDVDTASPTDAEAEDIFDLVDHEHPGFSEGSNVG